ncbi:MAG: PAS domain S-box protein [Deltaproteobacteria bacterium]|nr:PAS domain S-box protein [Deltaproteobacteria bacterium]
MIKITDPGRKRLPDRKGLRENEHLFRILTEKSIASIYIVQDGKFRFINKNVSSYCGYSREDLIGRPSITMIHPEDRDEVKQNTRAMLREEGHSPYIFRIITKQGAIRWIMEIVTPITFEGRPAILGNSMDITERKLTVELLQFSENRYRTIFETTGTATIVLEEDTTISLMNREFQKISGYTKEEVEGKKSWTEFVVPEDVERMLASHRLRRIDPEGPPKNYEFRLMNKSGEIKDILLSVDLIPDTTTSFASLLDITRFKQAEETLKKRGMELEAKTHELEELNAALRVLLKRREEDKNELEEKILSNMQKLVMPYLEALKRNGLDPKGLTNVKIIESNLKDIVSPFSHKLSSKFLNLTPKELQVANLIKEGKTTKEIAEFMDVCPGAIDLHRNHIRKKLNLNRKKINLQSYLTYISLEKI